MKQTVVGQHLLANLSGADPLRLRDGAGVLACLQNALSDEGFRILDSIVHQFLEGGGGCTAFVLLAESHAAVHTCPESGFHAGFCNMFLMRWTIFRSRKSTTNRCRNPNT